MSSEWDVVRSLTFVVATDDECWCAVVDSGCSEELRFSSSGTKVGSGSVDGRDGDDVGDEDVGRADDDGDVWVGFDVIVGLPFECTSAWALNENITLPPFIKASAKAARKRIFCWINSKIGL